MHLWFKYSIRKPEKKSFSRCDDMPYVSGFDRNQLMCCSWDAFVDEESIARIIDAFVEHLDMKKYGVKAAAVEGRPSYDPKSLTSFIFTEAEKESVLHESWQKAVR